MCYGDYQFSIEKKFNGGKYLNGGKALLDKEGLKKGLLK
jgi:hypothetical protein